MKSKIISFVLVLPLIGFAIYALWQQGYDLLRAIIGIPIIICVFGIPTIILLLIPESIRAIFKWFKDQH